jgi:hypothetical protein
MPDVKNGLDTSQNYQTVVLEKLKVILTNIYSSIRGQGYSQKCAHQRNLKTMFICNRPIAKNT